MPPSIIDKIKLIQDYISNSESLKLKATRNQDHLVIDFIDLLKNEPDLATELLDNPEETIACFEKAVKDMRDTSDPEIKVRFKNVEQIDSCNIRIRDIRVKDYKKFKVVTGTIRYISEVFGVEITSKFECPTCGNIINVMQDIFEAIKEPSRCGCGRKGKFIKIDKTEIDMQKMMIEEEFETLEGNQQPDKIEILIKYGLTNKNIEMFNTLGSRVAITGIISTRIRLVHGKQTNELVKYMDANYIKQLDERYKEVEISSEDKKMIMTIAKKDDAIQILADSYSPHIEGYNEVKKAIVLQLFGGVNSTNPKTGKKNRGDIHLLLIGDPSTGKTQLSLSSKNKALKFRYAQGVRASKAGITVMLSKDESSNKWMLEAGAVVLANKGTCVLDELDKMSNEDREALHENMEQGTITIHKANIHTTLNAQTSIIACANWKGSRFNPMEDIYTQIDMPDSLISRFDLYFVFIDKPDEARDLKIMRKILQSRSGDEIYSDGTIPTTETISEDLFHKWVILAKDYVPKMKQELAEVLVNKYAQIRQMSKRENQSQLTLSITSRQGEAIQRLAEASARLHFRDLNESDYDLAFSLVDFSLKSVALETESGRVDIDRIESGESSKRRNITFELRKAIDELSPKFKDAIIPVDEIYKSFNQEYYREVDTILDKMLKAGDLFEPRRGFIKKL